MACNLVSNFEVALIKKLWQFSMLSHTLCVAVPSPPPSPRGGGRVRLHVGYLEIPATFPLVCHAFLSITFAFSGYSRSVEVCNCHSDGRQIGTQIGQMKTALDIKAKNPLVVLAKIKNQVLKNGKSANHSEHQNQKSKVFWHKNRKTKNHKTENPNAPLRFALFF